MFKVRDNEPDYAKLTDPLSQSHNRYGQSIETVPEGDARRERSLNINGDSELGNNPNRYKQHGFFFNADNCIACHACETACSEKNDVPAHLAFRSVGFVEGGTYPAYQRINISMACNHCDDPVCLKGCPTRAYTKFAEYGAVLQDPDICFGCGYCTWVCPYNAPQLDPVKGQVSKCNMCVDRLEVGLKPACVSACLGNALDFGVIENIPEGQLQAKTSIPGMPDTDITHPNIRFQQTKTTQREMTRSDAMPVKYQKNDQSAQFEANLHSEQLDEKQWNWRKLLLSHESSHTVFTLSVQAVMGAFMLLIFAQWLGFGALADVMQSNAGLVSFALMIPLMSLGLFKLNMHLGKPHRFYRGFYNLKHSPVSREIAGVSGFFVGVLLTGFLLLLEMSWPNIATLVFLRNAAAFLTILSGLLGLYYMYRLYRIPARPYWDHWQTATAFISTCLTLGALIIAVASVFVMEDAEAVLPGLVIIILLGLIIETIGHYFHARDLRASASEGAASHYLQRTKFAYPSLIRNGLLFINIVFASAIIVAGQQGGAGLLILAVFTISLLGSAIIGRSLFYALVIPTTMPGAYFWKNQGFVEHARESGLADIQALGVEYERHHSFKWDELLLTVKETLGR